MKTKILTSLVLCFFINTSVEAQFFKKLKKKAEQAVERTVLNKTDEIVTKKTEKTIDDAANGNKNKTKKDSTSTNNSSNKTNTSRSPAVNPLGSKKAVENLPDTYSFDWEFKTEIKSSKNEAIQMNYLINSNSKDYFGMELSSKELKGQGTMCMVMDVKQETMIMFMAMNGQKMAQVTKIPKPKSSKKEPKYSFKEIGTKTILGYECYGMEIENADYTATVYFTLDAPVNFSAFSAFANNKNGPKGFDPALLKVLEEDALLMEMTAINKKKSKENFTMTAISLEKKETVINKSDYQIMKMGF